MEEIWKDVKGYETLYQVSNLGRVKSLKRKVYAGRGRNRWQYEKILSENKTNGNGYKIVALNKNGESKNKYIHRLVAEAFLDNVNNYKYINHKDENKNNNSASNLEFCTAQYNSTYNDLHIRNGGKNRNNSKISRKIVQLDDDGNIINFFPSIAEASRKYNVSNQAISDCVRGKSKHSVGFIWKYEN